MPDQEKPPKLQQQSKWMGERVIVDTPTGQVTYREWLEGEVERIRQEPGRIAQIKKTGLVIALFVNRPKETRRPAK